MVEKNKENYFYKNYIVSESNIMWHSNEIYSTLGNKTTDKTMESHRWEGWVDGVRLLRYGWTL